MLETSFRDGLIEPRLARILPILASVPLPEVLQWAILYSGTVQLVREVLAEYFPCHRGSIPTYFQ